MRQVVKTFIRSDQRQRVHIYQRDDGLFSFDEEFWPNDSGWVQLHTYSTLCETADMAEREALATFPWLNEAADNSN
jgi:hypothetical protein